MFLLSEVYFRSFALTFFCLFSSLIGEGFRVCVLFDLAFQKIDSNFMAGEKKIEKLLFRLLLFSIAKDFYPCSNRDNLIEFKSFVKQSAITELG